MALPDIGAWELESYRLTVFSSEAIPAHIPDWWQACVGSIPDATGQRPVQGESFANGPYADGTLELKSTLNRLDWFFASLPQPGSTLPRFDGDTAIRLSDFATTVSTWCANLNPNFPVVRIGLGVVARHHVNSRSEANAAIGAYVRPLPFDPDKVRDLGIQFSLVRSSTIVPDLEIASLSKWASVKAQLFSMQSGVVPLPSTTLQQFARAEFDVYTPIENFEAFDKSRLGNLIEEMNSSVIDILENGALT